MYPCTNVIHKHPARPSLPIRKYPILTPPNLTVTKLHYTTAISPTYHSFLMWYIFTISFPLPAFIVNNVNYDNTNNLKKHKLCNIQSFMQKQKIKKSWVRFTKVNSQQLRLWFSLFQCKTLMKGKTGIFERGEFQPFRLKICCQPLTHILSFHEFVYHLSTICLCANFK